MFQQFTGYTLFEQFLSVSNQQNNNLPPPPTEITIQYHPDDAESFQSHYYKLYTAPLSWSGAKLECENKGAYLVVITSSVEHEYIWQLATRTSFLDATVVWLGATDENQEGVWEWVSGESFDPLGYLVAQGDRYENYLELRLSKGIWEDFPIEGEQVGEQWYICEWDR